MRSWLNCLWMWLNQVFVNECTEILGIFFLTLSLLWWFGLYSGHGLRYRSFTITLRHTTLDRTPLDECSSPPRDVCLTTHNTRKIQTSMPPGFEPEIPANQLPQTHALDRAAPGIGIALLTIRNFWKDTVWELWRASEWIGYSVTSEQAAIKSVSKSVSQVAEH